MDDDHAQKNARSSPQIELRPETYEFMDAKSLCRYTCASNSSRKDVRDANAWNLLAAIQAPRPPRDALANDAVSRVRSQVRRRLLADALRAPAPTRAFRPNRFEDFTYFVRLEQDGVVIWEGDLQNDEDWDDGQLRIPLWDMFDTREESDSWRDMENFLASVPEHREEMDYIRRITITLVAIRKSDDAMISLGHFRYLEFIGNWGDVNQEYAFESTAENLFRMGQVEVRANVYLSVHHDDTPTEYRDEYERPDGTLYGMELIFLLHHRADPRGAYRRDLQPQETHHLLAYLAGAHHLERGPALATMEAWSIERDHD